MGNELYRFYVAYEYDELSNRTDKAVDAADMSGDMNGDKSINIVDMHLCWSY